MFILDNIITVRLQLITVYIRVYVELKKNIGQILSKISRLIRGYVRWLFVILQLLSSTNLLSKKSY